MSTAMEKLARWLAPELAKRADRHFRLLSEINDVCRWCDGEARVVGTWLLERDANYARPLDAPSVSTLPARIMEFREHLYSLRAPGTGGTG